MRAKGVRRRTLVVGASAITVVASVAAAGSVPAMAATNPTIPGTLTAIPVNGTYHIDQLFTGADGQTWFVTPQSQLGEISASGQTTLTDITLPHGANPAQIAAAGPEGVWTYSNTYRNQPGGSACYVGLITPDGVLHDMALPAGPVRDHSWCGGAAADASGDLWISLETDSCFYTTFAPYRPGARPSAMALGSNGAMLILEGFRDQAMVSYTSAGEQSSFGINARPWASGLVGLSDGMFWVHIQNFYLLYDSVTGTFGGGRTLADYDNADTYVLPRQTGVAANGSLWQAGQMGRTGTGVNRFFRLDTGLTISRSRAFPAATDGTQLLGNGTVAVSSTGVIWAGAVSTSGASYLVRFQPLP